MTGFNEAAIFRSRKGRRSDNGARGKRGFNEAAIFRSRKGPLRLVFYFQRSAIGIASSAPNIGRLSRDASEGKHNTPKFLQIARCERSRRFSRHLVARERQFVVDQRENTHHATPVNSPSP